MENFQTIANKLLRRVRRMMLAKNCRFSKGDYRFYYLHGQNVLRYEIVTEPNGVARYVRVKDWYSPAIRPPYVSAGYQSSRCEEGACPWHNQDL